MKKINKLGFTLIELLVVITIIWILATGATTIYTSQIQKARDSTRLNDVKALQSAIEQVYQDNTEYPHSDLFLQWTTWVTWVLTYLEKIPKDPKHWQPCNNWGTAANSTDCGYAYIVWDDNNGIAYWEYEVSTWFEAEWNVDKKAALDGGWTWIETTRFELWLDIANNSTAVAKDWITPWAGSCALWWATATSGTQLIVINWNPTTSWNECN